MLPSSFETTSSFSKGRSHRHPPPLKIKQAQDPNTDLSDSPIAQVEIMGGVQLPLQEGQPMRPDTAHNNQFDLTAAEYLYSRLQELCIPIVITTRHAAYAVQV